MNQSAAKFVVSIPRSHKIVEESTLQFGIENFAELPETKIEFSPKIPLFSVDAVWWATMSKDECFLRDYDYGYDYDLGTFPHCKFEVHVEAKPECILKSTTNFIAKGTIDSIEVLGPLVIPMDNGKGKTNVEIQINNESHFGPASRKLASLISSGASLVVDFSLSVELICEEKAINKFYDPRVMKNQIVANVSQRLIDAKYSDFEFNVKGSKFKVHKAILEPVSEVFANLFASEMEESKTNKCKVAHLDPIAFGHMLKFIYSGQLPEDFNADVALSLFEVAHYFNIKPLYNHCEREVLFGLNTDNALELFKLAQLYNLEEMKQNSWEIVKRDLLKIYRPLKQEPLTLEAIEEILNRQEKETKFYEKF